ncbi:RcnB family protein [Xanthomonas sp. AmX2]|uniref:RcnB family protein n=1 Tax=Xanthomonas sp. TaxID=29446 RepID=UPI00197EA380|nr:RcnB family protein [Xanthomonas sp.]MBN6150037.1 RcnB family protein [Xanthomonas sp.]
MNTKRFATLALSSVLALGFMAPPAFARDHDRDRDYRDRHGWSDDGRGHGHRDRDRYRDDRRDDRRYYRQGYRDGYRQSYQRDRGYGYYRPAPPRPHYWARGERYHDYYRGPIYVVNDYPRYELRRPPRGYHWVRDDRGNMLMVAIATGIIADLVLNGR